MPTSLGPTKYSQYQQHYKYFDELKKLIKTVKNRNDVQDHFKVHMKSYQRLTRIVSSDIAEELKTLENQIHIESLKSLNSLLINIDKRLKEINQILIGRASARLRSVPASDTASSMTSSVGGKSERLFELPQPSCSSLALLRGAGSPNDLTESRVGTYATPTEGSSARSASRHRFPSSSAIITPFIAVTKYLLPPMTRNEEIKRANIEHKAYQTIQLKHYELMQEQMRLELQAMIRSNKRKEIPVSNAGSANLASASSSAAASCSAAASSSLSSVANSSTTERSNKRTRRTPNFDLRPVQVTTYRDVAPLVSPPIPSQHTLTVNGQNSSNERLLTPGTTPTENDCDWTSFAQLNSPPI